MNPVIRIVFAVTLLLAAAQVQAQRLVTVNGQLMNPQQLYMLDQMACGGYVPNGHYWLNTGTGAWGYAGNPQLQGYLGQGCGSPADRPGYGGSNYRGPFGDYLSDGRCSFVNGIPVGDCD